MRTEKKQGTGTDGGGRRQRTTRTAIAASVAFVVLLVAAVIGLVVAMQDRGGGDGAQSPMATSTEPPATAPSTTDADASGGAAPTAPRQTSPPAQPALENGRHPVYLTDIDVAGRSIKFDLIQFLTGDKAISAWQKDHPDGPDGPPNGFYIINDNPQLRQLLVADDVAVTMLDWNSGFQPLVVTFADLPTKLAAGPLPYEDRLKADLFWLTVDDGTVTAIEEQFIP